jgi:hypothetical protein
MAVRREALHIFAEKYADEADQEFQSALLGANIAVREEAQYYFQKKGTVDLRAYYSDRLETSNSRQLCAAIAGVGESGVAKDSQLVERFLSDQHSKVRVAALHTIAKLNPDAYLDKFVLALDDASSKVAREAVLALSKKANSVGGQRLWEIFDSSRYPHGKRWALFLLARINKWESIAFLIQSLTDQNDSCVELSHLDRDGRICDVSPRLAAERGQLLGSCRIGRRRFDGLTGYANQLARPEKIPNSSKCDDAHVRAMGQPMAEVRLRGRLVLSLLTYGLRAGPPFFRDHAFGRARVVLPRQRLA